MNNIEGGCIHGIEGINFNNLDKKEEPTEKEKFVSKCLSLVEEWDKEVDPLEKEKKRDELLEFVSDFLGISAAKIKRQELLKTEASSKI